MCFVKHALKINSNKMANQSIRSVCIVRFLGILELLKDFSLSLEVKGGMTLGGAHNRSLSAFLQHQCKGADTQRGAFSFCSLLHFHAESEQGSFDLPRVPPQKRN